MDLKITRLGQEGKGFGGYNMRKVKRQAKGRWFVHHFGLGLGTFGLGQGLIQVRSDVSSGV